MEKTNQMLLAITKDHKREISTFLSENMTKEQSLKEIKKLNEEIGSIFLIDFDNRDVTVIK